MQLLHSGSASQHIVQLQQKAHLRGKKFSPFAPVGAAPMSFDRSPSMPRIMNPSPVELRQIIRAARAERNEVIAAGLRALGLRLRAFFGGKPSNRIA